MNKTKTHGCSLIPHLTDTHESHFCSNVQQNLTYKMQMNPVAIGDGVWTLWLDTVVCSSNAEWIIWEKSLQTWCS